MPQHTHKLSDCGAVTRSLIKFATTHTHHTHTHVQSTLRLCWGATGSGAHKSTQHFGSTWNGTRDTAKVKRQEASGCKAQLKSATVGANCCFNQHLNCNQNATKPQLAAAHRALRRRLCPCLCLCLCLRHKLLMNVIWFSSGHNCCHFGCPFTVYTINFATG